MITKQEMKQLLLLKPKFCCKSKVMVRFTNFGFEAGLLANKWLGKKKLNTIDFSASGSTSHIPSSSSNSIHDASTFDALHGDTQGSYYKK